MKVLVGAAAVVLVLVGCGSEEDRPSPPVERADPSRPPVELTAGEACGDAFFWAATASGDLAVTISVDARDRSAVESTTREFTLPDAGVMVEVLAGEQLASNFCNDAVNSAFEPRRRQGAVAGDGTIRLDPLLPGLDPMGCGSVSGELELTGLEAADGTTFAPIRVSSESIGCYSG